MSLSFSLSPHHRMSLLRIIAVGSFVYNTFSQCRCLFEEQPKQTIYSPRPFLFAAAVLGQAILQAYWLLLLLHREVKDYVPILALYMIDGKREDRDSEVEQMQMQMAYIPVYVVGNICLAIWASAWLDSWYTICQIALLTNIVAQSYAVFILFQSSYIHAIDDNTKWSRLVAKSSVALGMLYMWKTWGAIDKSTPPAISEMLNCTVVFLLFAVASGPDPTLGLFLLYDLIAMASGQHGSTEWHRTFVHTAAATAACTLGDWALARKQLANRLRVNGIRRAYHENSNDLKMLRLPQSI